MRGGKEDPPLNERPIIGILTQPGDPAPDGMSYIAASYVKWVESAGARVVPIFYDMTDEQIKYRFSLINGLLLPGGGAKLHPGHKFYDTANLLVNLALDANDAGDFFPIHGTCLGLETLSIIITQNYTLLGDFDAEDAAAPLLYTEEADNSDFIQGLPEDVQKALHSSAIAMENHAKGLSMTAYKENHKLEAFFKVISLSIDKSGNPYISTLEARKYPVVATQWHPEKNSYEWTPTLHIPHSNEAIRASQEVANYFIRQARRNMHKMVNQLQEDDMVIYNYEPQFTGRHVTEGEERDFDQAYFFQVSTKLDDRPTMNPLVKAWRQVQHGVVSVASEIQDALSFA